MVNEQFTSFRLSTKKKASRGSQSNGQKKQATKKLSELSDIDEVLRHLEVTEAKNSNQSCDCSGRRHPLNAVTPNCLNCGKIICARSSSSVCSFCGGNLLSNEELEAITALLRNERKGLAGESTTTTKTANNKKDSPTALRNANSNLNRLLDYQDAGAIRMNIIDQASDFDLPGTGPNKWSTASEQAEQLKKQQRQLKQQKNRNERLQGRGTNVLSIDLKGNKVVMNTSKSNSDYDDLDPDSDADAELSNTETFEGHFASPRRLQGSTPEKIEKIEKKLISPTYNKTGNLLKDQVIEQPSRLQTPEEYAYLEL